MFLHILAAIYRLFEGCMLNNFAS